MVKEDLRWLFDEAREVVRRRKAAPDRVESDGYWYGFESALEQIEAAIQREIGAGDLEHTGPARRAEAIEEQLTGEADTSRDDPPPSQ